MNSTHRPAKTPRFEELAHLTAHADWNSEGAPAISVGDWAHAREIACAVASAAPNVPPPFPSACEDGTIHVRWSDHARVFDLEIDGDRFLWSAEDDAGLTSGQSNSLGDLIRTLRALFS